MPTEPAWGSSHPLSCWMYSHSSPWVNTSMLRIRWWGVTRIRLYTNLQHASTESSCSSYVLYLMMKAHEIHRSNFLDLPCTCQHLMRFMCIYDKTWGVDPRYKPLCMGSMLDFKRDEKYELYICRNSYGSKASKIDFKLLHANAASKCPPKRKANATFHMWWTMKARIIPTNNLSKNAWH